MRGVSAIVFLNAARARIATNGIRGLSLRSVAQDAGTSLGSLNYRIGDKAALIALLVEEERLERQTVHATWLARAAGLDLGVPTVLAAIITAYLDQAATVRRDAALTGCELLLEAGLDPADYSGIASLIEEEEDFWRRALTRRYEARATVFGRAIACYCRDELPFSIAAGHDPNYRLLRAATIGRLAAGLAGNGDGLSLHFETLVAACGISPATAPLPVDLPAGSKKAELARYIADVIVDQGAASVTHRLVAAQAGVPNSSVAHHFRTRDDLLDAGMEALILEMRRELNGAGEPDSARRYGPAVIRTTHSIALAAARDPAMIPFALDMRRRRAENVREVVGEAIGGAEGLDRAAIQTAVLILVGAGLAALACGRREQDVITLDQLAALRAGFVPCDGS